MLRKRFKDDWRIWIIVLTPFITVIIHLSRFVLLFKDHFPSSLKEDVPLSVAIALLVLPIFNIFVYFILIEIQKVSFVKKNILNNYFKIRFLVHFFVSASFTLLFLRLININISEMFLIRFSQIMLVFMLGYFIQYIKPNQQVGIRIAWTLSNEVVWRKTHLFTSQFWTSFAISAMLVFPTILPANRNIFLIIFLVVLFIPPLLYSYLLYSKLNKST